MATSETKLRILLSPGAIEAQLRRRRAAFVTLFPDSGPLGREFYPKHLEFLGPEPRTKSGCSWLQTEWGRP